MFYYKQVINPHGTRVPEEEIELLISKAAPSTTIILDECHEWLGSPQQPSVSRGASNVIRVSSLSKPWASPGIKCGWFTADEKFVAAYYKHASTTYGGPPSIFYTLVEFLAQMEAWINQGVEYLEQHHVTQFDDSYNIDLGLLQRAFTYYREERQAVYTELLHQRHSTVAAFCQAPINMVRPHYSINMAVEFPQYNDSYFCFRELLHDTGVSFYPGILNFCFTGASMREAHRVALFRQ